MDSQDAQNTWVHRSEVRRDMSLEEIQIDEYYRGIRSILNKLTPQKFKVLVEMMLTLNIDTEFKMDKLAQFIFKKAVNEPLYSQVYAKLCFCLKEKLKHSDTEDSENQGCVMWFSRFLLKECQVAFESIVSMKETNCHAEENYKSVENRDEFDTRHKSFGAIIFIGQLFKAKMISENIIHDCILRLLKEKNAKNYEFQLECFCKLLWTAGQNLDHKLAQNRIDQYYALIEKKLSKKQFCSRVKFALLDIIDLRKNSWVSRRTRETPTTIDQIHSQHGG